MLIPKKKSTRTVVEETKDKVPSAFQYNTVISNEYSTPNSQGISKNNAQSIISINLDCFTIDATATTTTKLKR